MKKQEIIAEFRRRSSYFRTSVPLSPPRMSPSSPLQFHQTYSSGRDNSDIFNNQPSLCQPYRPSTQQLHNPPPPPHEADFSLHDKVTREKRKREVQAKEDVELDRSMPSFLDSDQVTLQFDDDMTAAIKRGIAPPLCGGNGDNKVYALLGDKLIDSYLYETLIESYFRQGLTLDAGKMSKKRAILVSNKNMAKAADKLLCPAFLAQQDYDSCSEHDKGTVLEALVGFVYMQESYEKTPRVRCLLSQVIALLTQTGEEAPSKASLVERLQMIGIDYLSSYLTFRECNRKSRFVCSFRIPADDILRYPVAAKLGLDQPITGNFQLTKRQAEEDTCKIVLDFLDDVLNQVTNTTLAASPVSEPASVSCTSKNPKSVVMEFLQKCNILKPSQYIVTETVVDSSVKPEIRHFKAHIVVPRKVYEKLSTFPANVVKVFGRLHKIKRDAEASVCDIFMRTVREKNSSEEAELKVFWEFSPTLNDEESAIETKEDAIIAPVVDITPSDSLSLIPSKEFTTLEFEETLSAKSLLSQRLVAVGIAKPATLFSTRNCGRDGSYLLYESIFVIPENLIELHNLPKEFSIPLVGEAGPSKSHAEENVSKIAIKFFNYLPTEEKKNDEYLDYLSRTES